MLAIHDVHLGFAGVQALAGVSLEVPHGELLGIIGPNGAGKTSLFNCISGVYRPQRGRITVDGHEVTRLSPQAIARLGVARMFQNLALFEQLSTLENLLLGRHHLFRSSFADDLLFSRRARREEVRHRRHAEEIIDFLHLERHRHTPVGALPYGVRKRIELGRALCMEPRLLLLDEPAAGLNQEETEDLARYVLDIKEEMHVTQVVIEHDLRFVFELADRVAVLDFGRLIASGEPAAVQLDPAVVAAYIGLGEADRAVAEHG